MTSTTAPLTNPRQQLSERQRATIVTLLDGGLDELRDHGYDQLSLRKVAVRAGVTHTTAYSYFTSKAHLVAEIYWSLLQGMPAVQPDLTVHRADRISRALEAPALVLADEPALAQAALAALLSTDIEVQRLRTSIGVALADRVVTALGPATDPDVIDAVLLAFSGAMLQAGMGYFDFAGVVERIHTLAALLPE